MSFELYVFAGEKNAPELAPEFENAYSLWEDVWRQTFKDLEGNDQVTSDNFSRQHEILALFSKKQCVALVCHRYVDLSLTATKKDSYFKPWPEKALEKLGAQGCRVAVGSQITVHPEFRKSAHGVRIKNVVTYLSLRCLSERPVDAVCGTMRVDKGMNKLFYECGAFPLAENVTFHNVAVDLVAFFPHVRPFKINPLFENEIEQIWSRKIVAHSLEGENDGKDVSVPYAKVG